jgi:Flp pilus assembly protein TadD
MAVGKAGSWNGATRHFEAAIKINPKFARGHYGLGMALAELGQRERALEQFHQALQLQPGMADAKKAYEALQSTPPKKAADATTPATQPAK